MKKNQISENLLWLCRTTLCQWRDIEENEWHWRKTRALKKSKNTMAKKQKTLQTNKNKHTKHFFEEEKGIYIVEKVAHDVI